MLLPSFFHTHSLSLPPSLLLSLFLWISVLLICATMCMRNEWLSLNDWNTYIECQQIGQHTNDQREGERERERVNAMDEWNVQKNTTHEIIPFKGQKVQIKWVLRQMVTVFPLFLLLPCELRHDSLHDIQCWGHRSEDKLVERTPNRHPLFVQVVFRCVLRYQGRANQNLVWD